MKYNIWIHENTSQEKLMLNILIQMFYFVRYKLLFICVVI